jgi:hypothetical protein
MSPAKLHAYGQVTVRTNAPQMAASTAFPPFFNIESAASVART